MTRRRMAEVVACLSRWERRGATVTFQLAPEPIAEMRPLEGLERFGRA